MKRRVWSSDATEFALLCSYTLAQAADTLGVPVSTLRSHLESNPEVLERALDERAKVLRQKRVALIQDSPWLDAVAVRKRRAEIDRLLVRWLCRSGERLLAAARAAEARSH